MLPAAAVLSFLPLLLGTAHGFAILPGDSENHQEITERGILDAVVQTCRDVAQAEGAAFSFPSRPYTTEGVVVACNAQKSSKSFEQAIRSIKLRNVRVDLRHALNASFHFDEEHLIEGRRIIVQGLQAVKASNKLENYESAQESLGEILHPLQDFYSHSNWVELGKKLPNANLIRSDTSIGNLADVNRATCRSCVDDDCTNNVLEDVIAEQLLTTGYFGIVPLVSTKPKGKCSHGGAIDQTSKIEPTGGINKDEFSSPHGHLHTQASDLAVAATVQLLEDVRSAAGDRPFLRMMGISKGSSKALCFVIDTSKSMSDDIEAVTNVANSIINTEVGTENEPATYILVPFGDPEFGPLIKTTDPKVFKEAISLLSVDGGGDDAELSLSGLQLALSAVPLNSEIFLFTDAPSKDKELKSTVLALIERTQTVVNFMITDSNVTNARRKRDTVKRQTRAIESSEAQLYRDLAQASGGSAIEVDKSELPIAASIVTESILSSLVTLLQASRNPGVSANFSFRVDDTVTNPRVYITGLSLSFTLVSPTGESQQSSDSSGSLITSSTSVGNFRSLKIKKVVGQWEVRMVSTDPYTLKVMGQSDIDFLFEFVVPSQGPFGGFDVLDTRPQAGENGTLSVTLTGSGTAVLTEVVLVGSRGSEEVTGAVEAQGQGNFLVTVSRMPSEVFVVRVKGRDGSSASRFFQRQSPTNFRTSNVTVTADSSSILKPGTPFSVPFSVTSGGAGGNFTIRAANNQRFKSDFPSFLMVAPGNSSGGTVTVQSPLNTPSGTDFTMTIEAEAPGGGDTNYIVLRFAVLNTVTDFIPPRCEQLSLVSRCSGVCGASTWQISVRVSDGETGVGVERVGLQRGNGTMNATLSSANPNVTLVAYSASCCSPDMELLVVDRVGNVGSCFYSINENSPSAQSPAPRLAQSLLLCLGMVALVLRITTEGRG